MPSNYQVNRALGRGKRKGLTHQEVMQKRHEKRRKKATARTTSLKQKKMDLLKEYKRLCSLEEGLSNKSLAMSLMVIVEEINEEGMNDNHYLQIMDLLMILHKSDEESALYDMSENMTRSLHRTMRGIHQHQNTAFYYDRIGDETQNIINELNQNIIETDNLIRERSNIIDNTVRNGWIRTGQGTWTINTLPGWR